MKQLIALHDITDDTDIEDVIDDIMAAIGDDDSDPVKKHLAGSGDDHDQDLHGDRDGGGDSTSPDAGSSQQTSSAGSNTPDAGEVPREDEAFVREISDKYLAQTGTQMQHIADNAGMEQMSIAGERRGIDTMGMYSHWQGDDWQGYTGERTEWQAQVLADMQSEQARANGMEPKQDSKCVVMLGLPGAGKSFLIKNELNEVIDTREFLTINADDVKSKIINEDTPPEIEGVQGPELAAMVHEESSYMRKRWEQTSMAGGTNMILDVTGANREKTLKVLDQLKAGNYDITIVHADVSVGEAQASALRRAATGGEDGSLGRIVPPSFIAGMASPTAPGQDIIDENFDSYLPKVNSAYWYRTFPLNVERAKTDQKPTQLLWSQT